MATELVSKPPASIIFVDGIAICGTSREKVEQELEKGRDQREGHALGVSRTKTEGMTGSPSDHTTSEGEHTTRRMANNNGQ